MKKISFRDLSFLPASHEDFKNPGVVKKILFSKKDFSQEKRIEMVNWAILKKGKSFVPHYHEDMDEIFIIISGRVKIRVEGEEEILGKGDAVLVPMKKIHQMENISNNDVHYLVIGISLRKGGRTIRV